MGDELLKLMDIHNHCAVDLKNIVLDQELLALIPLDYARSLNVVPIGIGYNELILAVDGHGLLRRIDRIRNMTGFQVVPVLADGALIQAVIDKHCLAFGDELLPFEMGCASAENRTTHPFWYSQMSDGLHELAPAINPDDNGKPIVHFTNESNDLIAICDFILSLASRRGTRNITIGAQGSGREVFFGDGTMMLKFPTQWAGVFARLGVMARINICGINDVLVSERSGKMVCSQGCAFDLVISSSDYGNVAHITRVDLRD